MFEARKSAACALAAGVALAGFATAAGAQDSGTLAPEQLFERLAPSVWTVETFDARNNRVAGGSAVVIGAGSLVTNCHVLVKASRFSVTRENISYGATLEHRDPERDLCLLNVKNFSAPAVTIAGVDGMKVGARVYAIGSPRGLEQTISDGLLSGIRRSDSGDFTALQITVPISPGSSGGGLFDGQGRLIGITTFGLRESQNLNFALPATWIAEVARRAQAASAASLPGAPSPTAAAPARGGLSVGRTFEYRLTDRLTKTSRTVSYRIDRVDGERVIFNQGALVHNIRGEVMEIQSAVGGEADASMPPGGWVPPATEVGATWKVRYRNQLTTPAIGMELSANAAGNDELEVAGRRLRTLRVDFKGYTTRHFDNPCGGPYQATAWYAPELGRVVRFHARTQGCTMASRFVVDEILELVSIY
ncbi:serine protease [Ramlibacter henchirensis]|uniref:Serine protease n=1 Tax=Ramlibacter henchirensis TaxID=204072 RepID=A0A4Z0C3I2_9BURK|nr:serine protease [Ramlibacter henchirensis]TFZ05394.1 serine protease [Ramlibacter henchirensis]